MPPVILNGSAGVTTNSGAVYDGIAKGTAVASTSGTVIDFTGIPSWVERITVMFNGVSTNATGSRRMLIQIGTGGSPTATGYLSSASSIGATNNTTSSTTSATNGFVLQGYPPTATKAFTGSIVITNITGNTWVSSGLLSDDVGADGVVMSAGAVTLSGVLNMVRITTQPTPDTFDAGSINIIYE